MMKPMEVAKLETPGAPVAPRKAGPRGKPYAPPKVARFGNMVDVTLKSGPDTDNSPANPTRTN